LAGCHFNEEEISRHFKKKKKDIVASPKDINGNKFATGQILKKPIEIVKQQDFNWLSSKVSRTLKTTR
jgi:hypothetical protein